MFTVVIGSRRIGNLIGQSMNEYMLHTSMDACTWHKTKVSSNLTTQY